MNSCWIPILINQNFMAEMAEPVEHKKVYSLSCNWWKFYSNQKKHMVLYPLRAQDMLSPIKEDVGRLDVAMKCLLRKDKGQSREDRQRKIARIHTRWAPTSYNWVYNSYN